MLNYYNFGKRESFFGKISPFEAFFKDSAEERRRRRDPIPYLPQGEGVNSFDYKYS